MENPNLNIFYSLYEKKKEKERKLYFDLILDSLCEYYTVIWNNTSSDLTEFDFKKYSYVHKKQMKHITEEFFDGFINKCKHITRNPEDKTETVRKIFEDTSYFSKTTNFFNIQISKDYPGDFILITKTFIDNAKTFDEKNSIRDIFQAMRNVWTMNMIQSLFNIPVELTPSIFAYSLLYPYTDNYLDDKFISVENKKITVSRLAQRLDGNMLLPLDKYEEKMYELIELIEKQYPRRYFYALFKSIFFINKCQSESLKQQNSNSVLDYNELLNLTISKGGISVLTDAYLVKGQLDMPEIILAYGLGFLLQLLDDLQDVQFDMRDNNETIFTLSMKNKTLDTSTNKMINFMLFMLNQFDNFESSFSENIKNALLENSLYLLLFSLSRNEKNYPKNYVKIIQQYYPFPPTYMRSFNKNLQRKYNKLKRLNNQHLLEDILSFKQG